MVLLLSYRPKCPSDSNFRAFWNWLGKHFVASVPGFGIILTLTVPGPLLIQQNQSFQTWNEPIAS